MTPSQESDRPTYERVDLQVRPAVYVADLLDDLGAPTVDVDWENVTVAIKVPVRATATVTMTVVDVPLGTLAALLAKHTGYDVRKS